MRFLPASSLRTALLSCVTSTLIFGTSLSHADDTEIFFGGPSVESGVRPNVLFILDNSGSMDWSTEDQSPPNNNPKGERQRMAVLKESFSTIISQAGAINAGLMVLNAEAKLGGSRLVYPVTYLENSAASNPINSPLILESGDDATQVSDATTATIDGPTVDMGRFQALATSTKSYTLTANNAYLQKNNAACLLNASLASPRPNGSSCTSVDTPTIGINTQTNNTAQGTALMYFSGLNIPAGSTVTSATLTVYPQNTVTGTVQPRISVENSKLSVVPNDNTPINTRTYTATRSLTNLASWTAGSSVGLNITQEINNLRSIAPTAGEVDNVLIKYWNNNTSDRRICMRIGTGCDITKLPQLSITYTSASPSDKNRAAALRFQNVAIPQGAIIESAQIEFRPAVANDEAVSFIVKAESSDDAAVFTNTAAGAPSARPKLSVTTTWTPDLADWDIQNPPAKTGPDVRNLVQEVVNQSGWCGNNSMAFFFERASGDGRLKAFSIDGAPGLQPTLTVTYSGGTTGCINPIFETVLTNPNNDGYEDSSGTMNVTATTLPLKTSRVAARFENVALKQGAQIMDAKLILTPNATVSSPSVSTNIRFQNADNAPALTTAKNNISSRAVTADSTCTIDSWIAGTPFTCRQAGIKTGLQTVINRAGWAPGNALLVTLAQSDSSLLATAFEGNPAQAMKLRIKVANGGLTNNTYTVRKHLDALVQSMTPGSGTPIVPTYNEASEYLSGNRAGYSSPITSSCQPTHVVLLTDGQANGNDTTTQNNIISKAGSCSTALPVDPNDKNDVLAIVDSGSTDSDELCGRKLADFLVRKDQASSVPGDSYVFTHTIGFALTADATAGPAATKFLKELAGNGKGGAYTAKDASGLTKAFSDILQNVQDVDTTFVSASAPVNSFERQNNKDELYFSLFAPRKTQSWPGNLKRYRFALTSTDTNGNTISDPRIVDKVGRNAVSDTGNFASTARSYWSDEDDGNDTGKGGAAGQLPDPASRKLYTYIGASPTSPSSLSAQPLTSSNTNITNTLIGAVDQTERDQLFSYIRGLDPTSSAERKAIGDPIHSSPKLATYSCITPNATNSAKCDKDDQTAFIGTNEGFVQAFSTDTGKELFAFMPEELIPNIKKLKENKETAAITNPRPYGMDSPVTLWVNDVNRDGKILGSSSTAQPGEFVYAYATMGRGGRGVYALDVTDRSSPKLLWYIRGGVTPGFDRLGQTWSAPVKTKIKVGSVITDVLVFAGGYNPNQDNVLVRTADTDSNGGNALYVVNAKTGALIWSASSDATSTKNLQMSKMLYSMPATPRVIDIQTSPSGTLIADANKLADQIFIGDMGGQVWRFHINNGSTGVGLITPGGSSGDGIFATAIPSNYATGTPLYKQQNLRRFYNEPDVALLNKDGKLSLSVNIGSGYRGHPLNKDAQDAFYSFRTNNLTDPAGTEGTITTANMLDVTTNLQPSGATQVTKLDLSDGRKTGGWYINLTTNLGEKVLTRALSAGAENVLFFSTYEPAKSTTANSNTCEPAFGTARGYAINLFDGSPAYSADPNNPTLADRFDVLSVPGIPPQPEMICIGDQCFIIRGPGDIGEIEMPKLGKMYWMDSTVIKPAP